jgi:glycogen(starch) synthase
MAGSGEMKDKIIGKVNRLGIADRVTFPGFLDHDGINELFKRTDVFVMPSVSEPFGLSSLEALQYSIPVIMSKQSGVSEVIKNAIKVDYWDIDALSDAISGILNYGTLSDFLSTKGGEEVNGLKWEKTGKKIIEVYKSVIG